MIPALPTLPVTDVLGDVRAALASPARSCVLVAPPGAGKTTLVPLALLGEPWLGDRKILVLEPRRLAARAAADRMSTLLGEDGAGGTVGYRVRMDTRVGARTRIEVVTEGVLTRMLHSDPALGDVALVVFDEFHERSLHADLGLALTLQARALFRDDLRLMVMSATLDAAPVARLLGRGDAGSAGGRAAGGSAAGSGRGAAPEAGAASCVTSEGRSWPVETRFRDRPVDGWIEPPVAAAVRAALDEHDGDVLVFLPGAGEIRRTADRLDGLPPGVDLFPLFGRLSRRDQDRAIAPSPDGRRKVVLATSIAETSLTIEGVRVVVDSGLMRVPRFDPNTGMTRLETVRVTRDAADQRRGRAGRTAPGVCHRLWTEAEDRGLVPHRRPEILEADLAPMALDLAVWGAPPAALRWLDPPPRAGYAQALELLAELDVVEDAGDAPPDGRSGDATPLSETPTVTDHGRRVASMGLHPRLAHMLARAEEVGLAPLACDLAALLGDRDILRAEGRAPDADLRLRVEALRAERGRRRGGRGSPGADVSTVRGQRVDRGGLSRALREVHHWRRAVGVGRDDEWSHDELDSVGLLAALAYPDRVGRLRPGSDGRFLLRNGRGARFTEPQPLARSEWIVAVEVDGRGTEARIFRAAPIALTEIETWFAEHVRSAEEVEWDPGGGIVRAHRRRKLGALVLSEAPLEAPDPAEISSALVDGVRDRGLGALPWSKETSQLRERLAFLHALEPERWPDTSEEALLADLETWLGPFLAGMKRLDDLGRVDLAEALLSRIDYGDRQRLDALAPTDVEVPSGSRVRVDYSDPDAPALAVRLQEVFGLTETPRVAGGRTPLLMKLLSPARRPVQLTTDLASFWRDAYFDVRKDMRGRYPKHHWPEDPLAAEPTHRTKRRS